MLMPVSLLLLNTIHSVTNPFAVKQHRGHIYFSLVQDTKDVLSLLILILVLSPLNMLPASSPVLINHLPRTHLLCIHFTYDSSLRQLLSTFLIVFPSLIAWDTSPLQ